MKAGDFTGIQGIPTQDMAMWESMGPIADRSEDHLGSSDLAVLQFRRQMVAAAKAFEKGNRRSGPSSRVRGTPSWRRSRACCPRVRTGGRCPTARAPTLRWRSSARSAARTRPD
jgi:hypothetical protein